MCLWFGRDLSYAHQVDAMHFVSLHFYRSVLLAVDVMVVDGREPICIFIIYRNWLNGFLMNHLKERLVLPGWVMMMDVMEGIQNSTERKRTKMHSQKTNPSKRNRNMLVKHCPTTTCVSDLWSSGCVSSAQVIASQRISLEITSKGTIETQHWMKMVIIMTRPKNQRCPKCVDSMGFDALTNNRFKYVDTSTSMDKWKNRRPFTSVKKIWYAMKIISHIVRPDFDWLTRCPEREQLKENLAPDCLIWIQLNCGKHEIYPKSLYAKNSDSLQVMYIFANHK